MPKTTLSKEDLAPIVLNEIRKCDGCESVTAVVLLESVRLLGGANWEIAVIIGSDNPAAVQKASVDVHKRLRGRYRIGIRANGLRVGDRVRLNDVGRLRTRPRSDAGTIVALGSPRESSDIVRVRFDGARTSRRLHFTYLEPIE